MNTISLIAIKRLANIRKYLEQIIFLGKIAPIDNFMLLPIWNIHRKHAILLQS